MAQRDRSSRSAAGLTLEALAKAALAEVARAGVANLTMTNVANRLGVRAPSLYHHVRDKHSLLELVAAQALEGVGGDTQAYETVHDLHEWTRQVADGSRRLRRLYLAHPGLAAVVQATADPDRDRRSDARRRLVQAQIHALVRLGIPDVAAREAVLTCARWTLAAVAADSTGPSDDHTAAFDQGLAWLLDGLAAELQERFLSTGGRGTTAPPREQ